MSHNTHDDDDFSARLQRVRGDGWPPPGSGHLLRGRADRQRRRRTAYAGGGLVAVAAAAVGLAFALQDDGTAIVGPPGGPIAITTSTASTSPTTKTSPTTSTGPTTTTPSGTSPSTTPRCLTTQLSAALTQADAGAGQRYAFLRLTNTGTSGCRIQGFGGVELRDAAGTVLATQARDHSAPAPSTLLTPGATVASRLHWTVIPGTGDPTDGNCSPGASALVVTPPDETRPVKLPWTLGPVCGMRIDQQAYAPAQ